MTLVVQELFDMGESSDRHYATVLHRGSKIRAVIVGPHDQLQSVVGSTIDATYELNRVECVESNLPRSDSEAGIFVDGDGRTVIDGTVDQIMRIDDAFARIDVRIASDDDIVTVNSDDLTQMPALNSRIRILGQGLIIYPSLSLPSVCGERPKSSDRKQR